MSSFAELKSKYNMFLSPAFKLEVDGKELSAGEYGIAELGIDLTLGSTSSACRFTVANLFKSGTRQLDSDKLDSLSTGKKFKASIGYGSNLTTVFYGYIASLGLRWSDTLSLSAVCLDARSLMRKGGSGLTKDGSTVKKVIEGILDKYKALISSYEVSIEDLASGTNITQTTDDLSFICGEAQKRGIDFRLDADKAYLKKETPKVCVAFGWEDCEISLDIGYLNTKYTMRGFDMQSQEKSEKSGEATAPGNQASLIQTKIDLTADPGVSQDAYEAVINGHIRRDVSASLGGSINCPGLPEIKPGALVKFTDSPLGKFGLGDEAAVASVRHSLGESGFRTSLTIAAKI